MSCEGIGVAVRMKLYRIELADACFGVLVYDDGMVDVNPEIGWTLQFPVFEDLKRFAESCGGQVREVHEGSTHRQSVA